MNSTTLHAIQSRAVSWALADCPHRPGIGRRDPARIGEHVADPDRHGEYLFYCITECLACGKPMHGLFTAWGTVRRCFEIDKDDMP